MNNINDILKSFEFYVSNNGRIRAYEMNKSWDEGRIFEYVIADKKITLYAGKEIVEPFWFDVNTFTNKEMALFWTKIPLSEAFMHPIFKDLFFEAIDSI